MAQERVTARCAIFGLKFGEEGLVDTSVDAVAAAIDRKLLVRCGTAPVPSPGPQADAEGLSGEGDDGPAEPDGEGEDDGVTGGG